MDRLSVMEELGAQFIITGQVSSMTAAYKTRDGKGYYDGSVSYTLKVINPKNGTLIGTKTFQHSGLTGGTGGNKEEAIANTIKSAVYSMRDFVDEYFKMEGTILEVNSEKKGKAEEVYINLGSMNGVKEAQKFTVYAIREVAGREAKKEIGRLTVKAVEGDDISLCKVQKGGFMFLLGIFLSATLCGQNYSSEVVFLQQQGNTLTVRALGISEKKKEAANMALKSAFYTLFYTGVDGVNKGNPMVSTAKPDYDRRFFDENRYSVFVKDYTVTEGPEKQGKQYRCTVEMTILFDALQKDLNRNKVQTNLGMAVGTPNSQVSLPTVTVVPYTREDEDIRAILDHNQMLSYAVSKMTSEFSSRGYKTKDFLAQLKRAKRNDVLTAGTQSDAVTKMIQNMGADIIVTAKVMTTTDTRRQSEVSLELTATEFQTAGNLASATFQSGKYVTTDTIKLTDYALKKVKDEFFTKLQASFNDIVKNGREMAIQMVLAKSITDWDFDQPLPDGSASFKTVLEDWLQVHALNGVYDMSRSNDKVIDMSVQVPIWDEAQGRAYTISRFSTELKNFLDEKLGGEYVASVVTMGQGLTVTIK